MSDEKAKKVVDDLIGSATLKIDIVALLKDARLAKVKFSIDGYAVNSTMWKKVLKAIEKGKIDVVYDKEADGAEYDYKDNKITYKRKDLGSKVYRAMMVHELTHAGWDLVYKKKILVTTAEAAAYLAQLAWYLIEKRPTEDNLAAKGKNNKVFQVACDLAKKLRGGEVLNPADIARLKSAVRVHSNYKKLKKDAKYAFNGI
jgi:hypothetical protein